MSFGWCVLTGERTGILASAEDEIDGEEDDDDLDASVETDEGIVADDTEAPATGTGEAVSESDAEKVHSGCFSFLHFKHYRSYIFVYYNKPVNYCRGCSPLTNTGQFLLKFFVFGWH